MSSKTCFKCGQEKPLGDFYKHPRMKDGRLNKCKDCARSDVARNRMANLDYYREYDRNRGNRQTQEYHQQYNETFPEKYKARYLVSNAIRDGKLLKHDNCEVCGSSGYIHGHHNDYSKPLDVMWLCVPCHKAIHNAEIAA